MSLLDTASDVFSERNGTRGDIRTNSNNSLGKDEGSLESDNTYNEGNDSPPESPTRAKRKSFESLDNLSPSKAIPTNKVTETSLTSSMSSSPVKFKDSVNMFQHQVDEPLNLNISNGEKPTIDSAMKEDLSTIFNNMFASITGTNMGNESLNSQTAKANKDGVSTTGTKHRSVSSTSSIASAGKSIKDMFLKDIDPSVSDTIFNKIVDSENEDNVLSTQNSEQPATYSVINNIIFSKKNENERFHTTFKSVPSDEQLLSNVFQVSLAKEKNKQKAGSYASSALSIGSTLTADTNHNISPDELSGIDGTLSNGNDKGVNDDSLFWFSNDYNKSEKNSGAFNANNNGELFISEKYIAFQSFKNLLNLWTTNILIYIHDIESINNVGEILINKHRANKDLKKMQENIVLKSKGNENGITITTVYDKTYAFYNIPEKVLAKRTLQTIWDVQVEGLSYLTEKERTPLLLEEPIISKDSKLSSRSLSNSNVKRLDSRQGLYSPSPNLLKVPSRISSKRSSSNLTKDFSSNDYLINRLSRQSSNSTPDKFILEESEIEDEIMSIDEEVGVSYNNYKKDNESTPSRNNNDNEYSNSQDERSVTTMKLSNKNLYDETALYDESDDSFDSDDDYYNGALKLSPEEYDKKINVFDFKESSKFNYTGPLYHEDTEFLISPMIDKEEEILAELSVDCAPGQLFEIMFSEQSNNFLIDFLEKQDSSNFQPLKFGKFDKMNQEGQRYREYQYDKKLAYPVGPSATRCIVKETILASNPDEFYKVINSTNTPDVPSGSAFNVKTCYQLRWSDNGKCFIKISFWVEWVKSSWIKGMVEKSCRSGQIEATKTFCEILLKYCEENIHQIEIAKGKAMRSLVFNHRLSVSSKKRAFSGGKSKTNQLNQSMDVSSSKKMKSPLFKPNSPRKSPGPLEFNKTDDVTELDLNSGYRKSILSTQQYDDIIGKLEKSEKMLMLQNILLLALVILLLLHLLNNWKGSKNWRKIYFDHFQQLLSANRGNALDLSTNSEDMKSLSDKEITEKLFNSIDQLISRRLEQQ